MKALKRNDVFTDAIINSYKLAFIERWTTEITHRVIKNYMNEIRSFKPLHSLDKILDLDISNWTNLHNLRIELMKDTYTNKSLFTKVIEAFDKEDFADASRLYLEVEDKMSQLRELYSIYKRNLLDI